MILLIILGLYIVQAFMLYIMYEDGITIKNIDIIMGCLAPLSLTILLVIKLASHFVDPDAIFLHKE